LPLHPRLSKAGGSRALKSRRRGDHAIASDPPPLSPPFGRYALPAPLEALRRLGEGLPSRWAVSLLRRLCLLGTGDAADVTIFGGLKARLHPRDNRAEKRVFCGSQFWDLAERERLGRALSESGEAPFVFIDAGANVGLYSLDLLARARRAGKALRILAVEPDPTNAARLLDNLAASTATEVSHAPVALGAESGEVRFVSDSLVNRGEARIADEGESGDLTLPLRPLLTVIEEAGFARVDAMKMDIEGHEVPVLTAFFATAPKTLWPRLSVLEVGKGEGRGELFELMEKNGYRLETRHKLNAVFLLEEPAG
jgi:FkbM family methyltransferase